MTLKNYHNERCVIKSYYIPGSHSWIIDQGKYLSDFKILALANPSDNAVWHPTETSVGMLLGAYYPKVEYIYIT